MGKMGGGWDAKDTFLSTVKWLVLLSLLFALLWCVFDTETALQMAAPCSFRAEDGWGSLMKVCRKEDDGNRYEGTVFAVVVIFIVASALGRFVVALKLSLPPLLGMLVAGLLLKNIPYIRLIVGDNVKEDMSVHIRDVCLALILCRAGLGLDLGTLLKMKWVIMRLAFMPCTAEAMMVAVWAHFLIPFDWLWAIALGWLWSAISPAVVVPSLLALLERGYGVTTGIVPAAIAASALDDVMSIVLFNIFVGFSIGNTQFEAASLLQILIQLAAGLALGVVVGAGVYFSTIADSRGETPALDSNRLWVLVMAAAVTLLACKRVEFTGCAALAVLVLALAAAKGWGPAASKRVAGPLTLIWNQLAQPLLFGLVGCQVDVTVLTARTVGFAVLFLIFSLIARFGTAFLSMTGRGLNWKERLFTALSQLPKATVQAALCGIPTTYVLSSGKDGAYVGCPASSFNLNHYISIKAGEEGQRRSFPATPLACEQRGTDYENALIVVQMAVVIILCTAPVGASIISIFGPKLLTQEGTDTLADGLSESLVPEVDEPNPEIIEKVLSFQAEYLPTLDIGKTKPSTIPMVAQSWS